jgi:two-component system LytT family sensor kinase
MPRLKWKFTALYHICSWCVLFFCILMWRARNHGEHEGPLTNLEVVLVGLPYVALYYLHAYWLMPHYRFQQRKTTYILLVILMLLIVATVAGIVLRMYSLAPPGVSYFQSVTKRFFPGLFILMASASEGAFRENFRLEKLRKLKETEHLRTELTFLRTQVNPHFMLNVLNSMVLLARKKSDLLEPVLLELARLMNYMLYDANNERICLEDEIGYLRAYIDLQMLRFGGDVKVRFDAPERTNGSSIEPMLLIPLVENAFKHGIGLVNEPVILIDIRTEGEERLKMTVKNKYNAMVREQEHRPSGIGLSNLTKRLELIYPGRFELSRMDSLHVDALEQENWYVITLNIPLQ